tara:strand:- start:293094 stop:293267 length:174 start_codon:yes stop_codon:yes gene_type:complete
LVIIIASKILKNIFLYEAILLNQADFKEITHNNDEDINDYKSHFNVKIKPELYKEVE